MPCLCNIARVVVVLQLRRACILKSDSSTRMITLTSKGNKWTGLGVVSPNSGNVDVLAQLN
jgi:hypothetical protein